MAVLTVKTPGRFSFGRKGQCIAFSGSVEVDKREGVVCEVYIIVGNREVLCDLRDAEEMPDGKQCWRFSAVYRVGLGPKLARVGCRMADAPRTVTEVFCFLFIGCEDIGESIKVPRSSISMKMGLNVVGPIQYESGLGEAARGSIKVLEMLGLPCAKVAAPMVLNTARRDYFKDSELSQSLLYKVNLFHLNGPEMGAIHKHWPRVFRNGQRNIAFWVFELECVPEEWRRYLDGVHEIWTPSKFSRDAIKKITSLPIYVIPTAIDIQYPIGAIRAEFALPENAVCVLAGFDLNSTRERKNPDATVAAFRLAWSECKALHLVLKISNADKHWQAMREIREQLKDVPDVTYITDSFTREKLTRLQAVCDIYLSLHRSEGFGLHLVECMALGTPVVATDWSANRDYLDESNGVPVPYDLVEIKQAVGPYTKGNRWAEANVVLAAKGLKKLCSDTGLRRALGKAASERITRLYSLEAVGSLVAARYRALGE